MGVVIDAHVYPMDALERDIDVYIEKRGGLREGAVSPLEFLEAVCPRFGLIAGDKFIVIWNEYYDEFNPCVQFLHAVDEYYFPGQEHDFWADDYSTIDGGVEFSLGDVFGEDFEYGGKFNPEDDAY